MRLRKKHVSRVAAVALAAAMAVSMVPAAFAAATDSTDSSDYVQEFKATHTVTINYKVNGDIVGTETVEVNATDSSITVTAPAGYELMESDNGVYPIHNTDGAVLPEISVTVRKKKSTTYTVPVNYYDNGNLVGTATVEAAATEKVDVSKYLPENYELMENDDGLYSIINNDNGEVLNEVRVSVRKKSTTYTVPVNYYDNGNLVGTATVEAAATEKVDVSKYLPENYELMESDDGLYSIINNDNGEVLNEVRVSVRKKSITHTVKVHYVVNGKTIKTVSVKAAATDMIRVADHLPKGYELMESDDGLYSIINNGDGSILSDIFVDVQKKSNLHTVKVHYVVNGETIKTETVKSIATAKIDVTTYIPEGYELMEGDDGLYTIINDGDGSILSDIFVDVKAVQKADDKPATPGTGKLDPSYGMTYRPIRQFFQALRNYFRYLFRG